METSTNPKEKLTRLPTVKPPKPNHVRRRDGCKNCKEKKKGCGREKPTCARCREKGLECIYAPLVPRRTHRNQRTQSTSRGGSPVDFAGPSTHAYNDTPNDSEDLSYPEDTSYDSSSASVTPSLAPGAIRSPLDLPYFRDTLAPLLVVQGIENPLVDLILPLSDRSELLLNGICLVAKAHQAQGDPTATPSQYLVLSQLVVSGHRTSLEDARGGNPDPHLATNVLLSYYEMIQGQSNASSNVRVYLNGGFSVLQYGKGPRTSTTIFLEKVLYFLDILMGLSIGQAPLNADPQLLSSPLPTPVSPSPTIDPVFGLSSRLWPTLHRLATAAQLQRQSRSEPGGAGSDASSSRPRLAEVPESFAQERAAIAKQLQEWQPSEPFGVGSPAQLQHYQFLIDHAEAFRAAGLIYVYRELCELEPGAIEVQRLAQNTLERCQRILAGHGPTFGLLWPLFTAAMNFLDEADIVAARAAFSELAAQRRMKNVSVAWKICEQVWTRRRLGIRVSHWHQAANDPSEAIVFG